MSCVCCVISPLYVQPLFSTDLQGQLLSGLRRLLDTVNNEVHSAEVQKLGHDEAVAKVRERYYKDVACCVAVS